MKALELSHKKHTRGHNRVCGCIIDGRATSDGRVHTRVHERLSPMYRLYHASIKPPARPVRGCAHENGPDIMSFGLNIMMFEPDFMVFWSNFMMFSPNIMNF